MQVVLPRELETFVQDLVTNGVCESPDEAIRQGLYLLQDHLELERLHQDRMRQAVAIGLEQADRGELRPGSQVFARLRERLEQREGVKP